MTKNPTAQEAAVLLAIEGFPVARVSQNRIFLRTPASAMNAADQLKRSGVDATAELVGQWRIRVG